ncbi:glycoside hydrolase family 18 protein [Pseudocercospora fijiensis CIRAD86]|uniref:chitinase n=1 Tax=Pseudocercospora fijiensis (strain CIRAD86) TaxID=383855 RepID=M2YJP9_PSEFD|nr:glycoside hydrolase family 18 protein [Pseudocercospora fijiensis CIRAD86]EME77980.1 glycoside hydrolase family 18 protein [Pseudocercospora fijiensis CIRAD86]
MLGFKIAALAFFTALVSASSLIHKSIPIKHDHLHEKVRSRNNAAASGHVTQKGFKTIGYYASWAIYGRNWPPQNIQREALTHVLYAFAGINNKTGEAYLTDEYADIQKQFDGDVPDNKTTNLYGNLKQLYLHKKKNRNLKTLLSIGGWNLRTYFAPALSTPTGRKTFAQTSVQLLKDHGFDGLDIDWEYPNSTSQASDLVDTARLFREELDAYSANLTSHPHFLLTMAVPAGPENFQHFDLPKLNPYVDFLNLMAYDYQGASFSNFSGHNSNFFKSQRNPQGTDFCTQDALEYYIGTGGPYQAGNGAGNWTWSGSGFPAEKIMLGMPLYGRSFANTSGPGTRFSQPMDGSWEAGVWDYKDLPFNGSRVQYDYDVVASWSMGGKGNHSRYMVSYDEPAIALKKAEAISGLGLGGAMWWELSGDLPVNSSRSLIGTVKEHLLRCGGLEQCRNVLDYPYSKYKNLREGMPGQ